MTGLYEKFIRPYLTKAGFSHIRKVFDSGIFNDTNSLRVRGEPPSA
jgi:hypothetical protein